MFWLLCCLCRERNDKKFEDIERMVTELKFFFLKILFHWTTSLDFNLLSFHDFFDMFSLSS
jgi:hypothetical protein